VVALELKLSSVVPAAISRKSLSQSSEHGKADDATTFPRALDASSVVVAPRCRPLSSSGGSLSQLSSVRNRFRPGEHAKSGASNPIDIAIATMSSSSGSMPLFWSLRSGVALLSGIDEQLALEIRSSDVTGISSTKAISAAIGQTRTLGAENFSLLLLPIFFFPPLRKHFQKKKHEAAM
jgi:hypothetical protein